MLLTAPSQPHTTLFYVLPDGTLQGQSFNSTSTPGTGLPADWLNPLGLRGPTDGGHMSSYWPYFGFQSAGGPSSASVSWFSCDRPVVGCLQNHTLPAQTRVAAQGGLAVLPTAVRYFEAGGLVFVAPGGALSKYLTTSGDSAIPGWSWSPGPLGVTISPEAAVGAFVYGASGGTGGTERGNLINTYVLYQGARSPLSTGGTGDIFVVSQNGQGAWKGPTSNPVLAGADLGTDITCLTMQAWDAVQVNISSLTDMNLCWFQAGGGKLKEVWFDGATWHDKGFLRLG